MASVGSDTLFENHAIKEIQEIEKKLRNDIERKKEELRQMVGERYHDLMEAADTITEMKEVAKSVTSFVKSMENNCIKLQSTSLQSGILYVVQDKVSEKKKANEQLYIIASQIKILMDSPTKIWTSIEKKDFIRSVSLFLLSKHTHSLLMRNLSPQDQKIISQFPVIHRQKASINQFRNMLIQNSHQILESMEAEPEDVLGPLCCYCLLFNSTLSKIFVEFLNTRKNLIKGIFHPEKYAKTQVCEFVNIVLMTLKIIHVIFYPIDGTSTLNGYKKNLLYQSLLQLVSSESPGPISLLDLNSSEVFKFLPHSVKEFRPNLSPFPEPCSVEFLRAKCNAWLDDIKNEFQSELREILNFVNTVKNLSSIQETLFEIYYQMTYWEELCEDLLSKSFSVWDFFFKDCFLKRIEDIIIESVRSAFDSFQKDIENISCKFEDKNISSELEKNISFYVWSESSFDTFNNVSWYPRHHRNVWDSGELSLKSKGFTPNVQSICKNLDLLLQRTLDDLSYFSHNQIEFDFATEGKELHNSITEMNEDNGVIYEYLAQAVEKYLIKSSSFIETTISCLESEKNTTEKSQRIIFLGHLCNGIINLCPHTSYALLGEKYNKNADRNKMTGLYFSSAIMKENEKWKSFRTKILETSASAFRLWSNNQISDLVLNVESALTIESAEGLLKLLLQWDKIEIQEESEQGKAVKSVLRIPQHISTPVFNALFAFCSKLNDVGGFSINSNVRSTMSEQLLKALLTIYKQKIFSETEGLNPRLHQVQSLQILFDVQFLTGLMLQKNNNCDSINSLSQEIINEAVSHIDPFDMDVFSMPLQHNIKKALQKSLSLFGLITSLDQMSYLNSFKPFSTSCEMDHNVMLTCVAGAKLPLLPLPCRTTQEQLPQPKETEVKSIHSHSSSPNLTACDTPTNALKPTASFYEKMTAMSSSWFGN